MTSEVTTPAEVYDTNLDELFTRHPDTWQHADIERMVTFFRNQRLRWMASEQTKPERKTKAVKEDKLAGLSLEGIEL